MSGFASETEELIARLSHRHRIVDAMIPNPGPPTPARNPLSLLTPRTASLGTLDCFPREIISLIVGLFDVQSMAAFSKVSHAGYVHVHSHVTCAELIRLAPHVLSALSKLGLAHVHSIKQLRETLRTERCATCAEFGPFLFLPTCDRCCWQCLRVNSSYRLLPRQQVKKFFLLKERHMKQLPIVHVIPGTYDLSARPAPEGCKLVAVKWARDLAIAEHGSREALGNALETAYTSAQLAFKGFFYFDGRSTPPGRDQLLESDERRIPADKFFGMASIPFPFLSDSGSVDNGLWCRGCQYVSIAYIRMRLSDEVIRELVPSQSSAMRVLLGLHRRGRSEEGFLEHIKNCRGVKTLDQERRQAEWELRALGTAPNVD